MTQADILATLVCGFTKHMAPCTFTILRGDEKRLYTSSRKQCAFNLTRLGSRQGFATFGVVRDALSVPCLDRLYRLFRRPGSIRDYLSGDVL